VRGLEKDNFMHIRILVYNTYILTYGEEEIQIIFVQCTQIQSFCSYFPKYCNNNNFEALYNPY
jgi:hypothetical protein